MMRNLLAIIWLASGPTAQDFTEMRVPDYYGTKSVSVWTVCAPVPHAVVTFEPGENSIAQLTFDELDAPSLSLESGHDVYVAPDALRAQRRKLMMTFRLAALEALSPSKLCRDGQPDRIAIHNGLVEFVSAGEDRHVSRPLGAAPWIRSARRS